LYSPIASYDSFNMLNAITYKETKSVSFYKINAINKQGLLKIIDSEEIEQIVQTNIRRCK